MSAEHKRPLLAFALVAIACMLILANALRTEAVRGYLKDGASRVVAGVELALDHPSTPQPVVAPPAAAAPFDRLDPAVPSGRPTSRPSASTTPAPSPLPAASAAPTGPIAPPEATVPAAPASVEATAGLASAAVVRAHPVHRVAHRVHRTTHAVHRAVRRVTHRVAPRTVHRATHRDVPLVTDAVSRPVVRGHHRALGHRDVRGGAPRAVLARFAHAQHTRPARAHSGPHGRGHQNNKHHGHSGKHHGHPGRH